MKRTTLTNLLEAPVQQKEGRANFLSSYAGMHLFLPLDIKVPGSPAPMCIFWRACSKTVGPSLEFLSVALEWDLRICLSIGSQVDAITARSGGHTLRTTALGRRELNLVRPGFLNLSPTDILDWITVMEGYLVH